MFLRCRIHKIWGCDFIFTHVNVRIRNFSRYKSIFEFQSTQHQPQFVLDDLQNLEIHAEWNCTEHTTFPVKENWPCLIFKNDTNNKMQRIQVLDHSWHRTPRHLSVPLFPNNFWTSREIFVFSFAKRVEFFQSATFFQARKHLALLSQVGSPICLDNATSLYRPL